MFLLYLSLSDVVCLKYPFILNFSWVNELSILLERITQSTMKNWDLKKSTSKDGKISTNRQLLEVTDDYKLGEDSGQLPILEFVRRNTQDTRRSHRRNNSEAREGS